MNDNRKILPLHFVQGQDDKFRSHPIADLQFAW